jgi:hypothetical protein
MEKENGLRKNSILNILNGKNIIKGDKSMDDKQQQEHFNVEKSFFCTQNDCGNHCDYGDKENVIEIKGKIIPLCLLKMEHLNPKSCVFPNY